MKKYFILSILLLSLSASVIAQDARVAQSYANPLKLNPAIMGSNQALKAIMQYRKQWKNIDKGFSTFSFTGLYPLYMNESKEKLDIGLNFISDKAGAFSTSDAAISVGYNVKTSNLSSLCFALYAGYVQKSLRTSGLTFDEQYVDGAYSSSNPHSENPGTQKSYPDVGFGMMWYYNTTRNDAKLNPYIGFATYHLNKPNESFVGSDQGQLPIRSTLQGGIKIRGERDIDFNPNFRMMTQKGAEEIAAGLNIDFKINDSFKTSIGTYYRTHDAIALSLGFELEYFAIGYAYDMVTDLSNYVDKVSANEFLLIFKLNQAKKNKVSQYAPLF